MEQVILPSYRIGEDILANCGGLLASKGKRALVIGGKTALSVTRPLLERAMSQEKMELAGEAWYGGECTYAHMDRLASIGRGLNADLIIGVGGGKALDTAKGCAHLLAQPVITIPTIAATCAAVTDLSVVYDEKGVYTKSMFHDAPPAFAIIDLAIIAASPIQYLRAGVGDAMAKHIECTFAGRGRQLSHSCVTAETVSRVIYTQILAWAEAAFRQVAAKKSGEALKQVTLVNVVSTGMVSLLTEEIYNGGVAHALFYGLTQLDGFEQKCLHGDAVGYGVLVQLMLDGQQEEFERLRVLFSALGLPLTLKQLGVELSGAELAYVASNAVKSLSRDRAVPYAVTEKDLCQAIFNVENR